jgi:predicted ester cyclase
VWSKGNFELISSIYTEDYVGHFPGGQTVNGRDGIRNVVASHRVSFPDWDEQVLEVIVSGERAATRYRSRGTHDGDFFGIPATGNVEISLEFRRPGMKSIF